MGYIRHKTRSASAGSGDISTDKLYGVAGAGAESPSRASMCVNMVKSGSGAISKRQGYNPAEWEHAPDSIGSVHIYEAYNGDVVYYLFGNTVRQVRNGTATDYTVPFDTGECRSLQMGQCMVFFGGGLMIANAVRGTLSYWHGNSCGGSADDSYLPTIYIANTPGGAGSAYEAVNLLNRRVAEQYAGDGSSTVFSVHLEGSGYTAYVKTTGGSWQQVAISDSTDSTVTLASAPPKPDIEGEDNVRIEYIYDGHASSFRKVSGCKCGAVFGVGGMGDRVFLSGSLQFPGVVYYSHMDEPTYFADLDYIKVGDCETDVFAMTRRGDTLALIADGSIYTVVGTQGQTAALKQDALFAISDIYSTPQPEGRALPRIFMDEPVYITRDGICAITPSGILDERCADIRSARINPWLLKEELSALSLLVFRDMLFIYGGERIYLLDGRQYTQVGTERRYEGFIWEDIPAVYMWVYRDALYFTDGQGIFRMNDGECARDFCDERAAGEYYPINAYWESPVLYPSDFKDFKYFTRVGVRMDTGTNADIRVVAVFDGDPPREVMGYSGRLSRFCYEVDYGSFCYKGYGVRGAHTARLLHKRGKGLRLRFENGKLRSSMTLLAYGAEFMKM